VSDNVAAEETAYALYPELLRRLDDSSDPVRIAAAPVLAAVLQALPRGRGRHAGVAEVVARAALVHADDPSPAVQAAVLGPLRAAAALRASTVRTCLAEAHGRHGSAMKCRCDEVRSAAWVMVRRLTGGCMQVAAMCDAEEQAAGPETDDAMA
jgi:hypothetical protein